MTTSRCPEVKYRKGVSSSIERTELIRVDERGGIWMWRRWSCDGLNHQAGLERDEPTFVSERTDEIVCCKGCCLTKSLI